MFARTTLLGRCETVKTIVTHDMTVVVVVVASNRRWGLSIPYSTINNVLAHFMINDYKFGTYRFENLSHITLTNVWKIHCDNNIFIILVLISMHHMMCNGKFTIFILIVSYVLQKSIFEYNASWLSSKERPGRRSHGESKVRLAFSCLENLTT
jgi:hypothetical protein